MGESEDDQAFRVWFILSGCIFTENKIFRAILSSQLNDIRLWIKVKQICSNSSLSLPSGSLDRQSLASLLVLLLVISYHYYDYAWYLCSTCGFNQDFFQSQICSYVDCNLQWVFCIGYLRLGQCASATIHGQSYSKNNID